MTFSETKYFWNENFKLDQIFSYVNCTYVKSYSTRLYDIILCKLRPQPPGVVSIIPMENK